MTSIKKISKLGKFILFAAIASVAGSILHRASHLSSSELPTLTVPTAHADIAPGPGGDGGCDSGGGGGGCF